MQGSEWIFDRQEAEAIPQSTDLLGAPSSAALSQLVLQGLRVSFDPPAPDYQQKRPQGWLEP
jgi:hypothetical protein